jgi:pentatricopeptide repeat protein
MAAPSSFPRRPLLSALLLLIIPAGESFSPATVASPVTAASGNKDYIAPASTMRKLRAMGGANEAVGRRQHANRPPSRRGGGGSSPTKRVPQNKRTAIRWVIQGVERCLAEKEGGGGGGSGTGTGAGKSYGRIIDASLVDALYLMANAYNQKDVLDAEKRLEVLMEDPDFPIEVVERVIKAAAMAGLASLSSSLLNRSLSRGGAGDDGGDAAVVPSPMAYTAVMNALRKIGRIDGMERTLADLASASRRASSRDGGAGGGVGIDVVAFNVYLAALCDAAVDGVPFSASAQDAIDDDGELSAFNFTSLAATHPPPASSSEMYLRKAANLLRGDDARERFALSSDPDLYSFNQVLDGAARCSRPDGDNRIAKSIMASCLRGMNERGIKADILTYNARLRAALATDGEEAAIRLYDQILSDPNVTPDRYTIDFMLRPLVCARRLDDMWNMLNNFYEKNVEGSNYVVSSAFEAFLITMVDMGEIELARGIFQSFFLKMPKKLTKRMQLSRMVHVMNGGDQPQQKDGMSVVDSVKMVSNFRDSVQPNALLPPKTRHFNILLGGCSKAYHSVVSKVGKSRNLVADKNDPLKDLWSVSNATLPNVQNAFELLDIMIGIGVPLDAFSVSSLMALPYATPEDITSLLVRIEPEMIIDLNPAAYRSVISAYGKAGDPSSAFWMFEEMTQKCRNQGRNVESWNAILGALAKGCDINGGGKTLDILNSNASRARSILQSQGCEESESQFISLVDGDSCLGASFEVLNTMRNGTVLSEGFAAPKPNSQTYCLVASALSGSGALGPSPDLALTLFRNAMEEGVAADGRFLNAVLRCFGDDIEAALSAWKRDIGPAAANYERTSKKRGANVLAAYNGLMHVCGRAIRPDIATRIAYAMKKSGYEPTEVSLNSYLAGKRMALNGSDGGKNMGLSNQYESALFLECTKYNMKDKRRVNDKKIRIIL